MILFVAIDLMLLLLLHYSAATAKSFPPLERILSEATFPGLSSSDLAHLAAEATAEAIKNPSAELPFFLCVDTSSIDLTKDILILESKINAALTVVYIESKLENLACFQTSSTVDSLSSLNGNHSFQSIPALLKIHESTVNMASKILKSKENIPQHLVVHFSRSRPTTSLLSDAEIQRENQRIFFDALSAASLDAGSNAGIFDHGSWAALLSRPPQCKKMPTITDADVTFLFGSAVSISTELFASLPMDCFTKFVESLALQHRIVKIAIEGKPVALNLEARGITQSGEPFIAPFSAAGLNGYGQVVGAADEGLNDLSCFFYDKTTESPTPRQLTNSSSDPKYLPIYSSRRKVIQYNYNLKTDMVDPQGGHGTHVVGSIIGSCLDDATKMNGIAPEAKLSFFDIGKTGESFLHVSSSLTFILAAAYATGARVHSNSWGNANFDYDSTAEELDTYLYNHTDFLVLFGAGNRGIVEGNVSLLSTGTAKNSVTVGALQGRVDPDDQRISESTVASFSSLGPTQDGRYGVDICAPGHYIISAYAGNPSTLQAAIDSGRGKMQKRAVREMSGTSMATPISSGNALLIRQYFMNNTFWASVCKKQDLFCKPFAPSASLLKGLLIQSGSPVKRYSIPEEDGTANTSITTRYLGAPPDKFQGFGAVTLQNILTLKTGDGLAPDLALFVFDYLTLTSNQVVQFNLTISDSIAALNLFMKASIAWTDIPYSARSSGKKNLINDIDLLVVTPSNLAYWGNKIANGDHLNPVEMVYLDSVSETGIYSIYLKANNLVSSQNVSFVLTYPNETDIIGPKSVGQIPSISDVVTPSPTTAPGTAPLAFDGQNFNYPYYEYKLNELVACGSNLTPLKDFSANGKLMLVTLRISNQPVNNAFALSVIINAPNGYTAQIGANARLATNVYNDSNLYLRFWESQLYIRNGGTNTTSTRNMNGSELYSAGNLSTWYVNLGLFGCGALSLHYQGSLILYFSESGGDTVVGSNEPNSSSLSDGEIVGITLGVIIFVGLCVSLSFVAIKKFSRPADGMAATSSGLSSSNGVNL